MKKNLMKHLEGDLRGLTMNGETNYYSILKPDGTRILVVYLMLDNRQVVNYERIKEMFEISYPTFMRLIASLRDALDSMWLLSKAELIFNKGRNSYELIKY